MTRFLIAFSIPCVVGCASVSRSPEVDKTGGLEIEFFVRDETHAETYYEVSMDGVFGFGGGLDARLFRTTWSDALTPNEIKQIKSLIDELRLHEQKPMVIDENVDRKYRLAVRGPQGRVRHSLKGVCPELEPLHSLFHSISLRRLNSDLQALPKPGLQER